MQAAKSEITQIPIEQPAIITYPCLFFYFSNCSITYIFTL